MSDEVPINYLKVLDSPEGLTIPEVNWDNTTITFTSEQADIPIYTLGSKTPRSYAKQEDVTKVFLLVQGKKTELIEATCLEWTVMKDPPWELTVHYTLLYRTDPFLELAESKDWSIQLVSDQGFECTFSNLSIQEISGDISYEDSNVISQTCSLTAEGWTGWQSTLPQQQEDSK